MVIKRKAMLRLGGNTLALWSRYGDRANQRATAYLVYSTNIHPENILPRKEPGD